MMHSNYISGNSGRLNYSPVKNFLILGLFIAFMTACGRHAGEVSVPVETDEPFSESGQTGTQLPDRWWTSFEDEGLNKAVSQSLESNFDLKTAWQRLKEAQAVVDRQASGLFPDLSGTADGEVTRSDTETQHSEDLLLGLTSTYEVDLWGRIGSSVDAERFRAEASMAEYQAAALSLSAETALTWYRLAEARHQLELIESQIETNQAVLELIESQFGNGLIRGVDILRQRQLLESTREQKSAAEARIEVSKHQLAVLTGRPPQESMNIDQDSLPELPPLPETGLPTTLVQRRPDVQQAFYQLQAADKDLASAISNQYPRLTLSVSASTLGGSAGTLFENWAASFAGNLLAPIFRGGELRAEANRNEAVRQQRLYEYGQSILVSFQEVEDALIREQKQQEQIKSLRRQVNLATQAYEQLRIEYFNGISNYLDVLTALDELQQLRRDLLSANLNLVEFRIALYRALAGSLEIQPEDNT